MTSLPLYPFTAIVAQEQLKRALLLAVVNPRIGGVLVRGEKGSAKSTAVRGLAALLPDIAAMPECPYSCDPASPAHCQTCLEAGPNQPIWRPARIVDLPIGTTEDRLLGALDLERALKSGERHFEPGLLARANRGILYVDEVNLLADHLVDALLDAAAMGVNTVEREGISHTHPAEFILIGSMNPEEGELRPQLLDRFGLMAEVGGMRSPDDRAEVVRRRIAFERDPQVFNESWQAAQQAERNRVIRARSLLPSVELGEDLLELIIQICLAAEVDGLRADLTIHKAAVTLAALASRTEVVVEDVRQAAELALPHRRRRQPFQEPRLDREALDQAVQQYESKARSPEAQDDGPGPGPEAHVGAQGLAPLPAQAAAPESGHGRQQSDFQPPTSNPAQSPTSHLQPRTPSLRPPSTSLDAPAPMGLAPLPLAKARDRRERGRAGRRIQSLAGPGRGQVVSARLPADKPRELAVAATLRAAAPQQLERRQRGGAALAIQVAPQDWREPVRRSRSASLIIFLVDASGSMGAQRRMAAAKGAILALLSDAYRRRDRVAMIAFRGDRADLLLPPTSSVELAERCLRELPTGGRTPLSQGLVRALEVGERALQGDRDTLPLLVLVSDGRANVSRGGGDPLTEASLIATRLRERGIRALVIDAEAGRVRLGLARKLSEALGARCQSLEELSGEAVAGAVRSALSG